MKTIIFWTFLFALFSQPGFSKQCDRKSDKAFRKALNKCIKEGYYQVKFDNECPSRGDNYSCFSAYEDETAELPETVLLRSKTQTFNPYWDFVLHNHNIWVKRRNQSNAEWIYLAPHKKNYRPYEISSDDRNLIALDPDRKVYTMFGALAESTSKFWWRDTWGLPFWLGGTWRIPQWVKSWDISFFSPAYDKYHADTEGNLHDVGVGVTHIWMLNESGQRVVFNDPWLPHDTSYETCSPLRGKFKSHVISTNGSKIFVMNEYGDMFTKSYDFDMAGYNGVAFDYTYRTVGPIMTDPEKVSKDNRKWLPRKLPVEDWVKQPKINGVITNKISVHKLGPGGEHRVLRVEGMKNGITGYFEKESQKDEPWTFVPTGEPLKGKRIQNSLQNTTHLTMAKDESVQYRGEKKDFTFKLLDFHPYCTPSTLRITNPEGKYVDVLFHHRGQIRIGKSKRGITRKPKGFKGAIEIPENVLLSDDFEKVLPSSIIQERIIDIEGSFDHKKIEIEAKKKLKLNLSRII